MYKKRYGSQKKIGGRIQSWVKCEGWSLKLKNITWGSWEIEGLLGWEQRKYDSSDGWVENTMVKSKNKWITSRSSYGQQTYVTLFFINNSTDWPSEQLTSKHYPWEHASEIAYDVIMAKHIEQQ